MQTARVQERDATQVKHHAAKSSPSELVHPFPHGGDCREVDVTTRAHANDVALRRHIDAERAHERLVSGNRDVICRAHRPPRSKASNRNVAQHPRAREEPRRPKSKLAPRTCAARTRRQDTPKPRHSKPRLTANLAGRL